MKVEIIAIGNEVVYGHTVNTNASYLAKEVQALGMQPVYMSALCDDRRSIKEATQLAMKRSDIILFTGGLGPTPDDLTKEAICDALDLALQVREKELEQLKSYFNKLGRRMTVNNEKQAAFPSEAIVLPNDCGTAPGMVIEREGRTLILLPGPPKEMKMMFFKYVRPLLQEKSTYKSGSLDIKCFGIGESELAARISHLLGTHGTVTVATYIDGGEVVVRITAYGYDEQAYQKPIDEMKSKVESCLSDFIIGYNEDTLEQNVVSLLLKKHLTVSTVESCTGGLIAATLVNCSGASGCLNESIVTYSNEAKMAYVGVQKETLDSVGAVSEETARQMAEGIRKRANVDIGLASTGIAGPGGGTPTKPVGLVYIGIAMKEQTEVFKLQLNGSRQEVREKTVKHILFQLYQKLK
ncbi:MAG: competence/damage-inducible protein A [Cellulosilyticum sp.]|nr:competence/damage-inducible protein A [Cellulosilyticum sp.]